MPRSPNFVKQLKLRQIQKLELMCWGRPCKKMAPVAIHFDPHFWIVAHCYQITNIGNFGANYLLSQSPNDYEPLIKVREYFEMITFCFGPIV
jgi:hypothetical protein